MLNRFLKYRWLQVCLVLICVQSIRSDMLCSDPPAIENGKHQLHSEVNNLPILGSTIVYSCNVGYELENDMSWGTVLASNLTCDEKENRTAYWRGDVPKCKKMQCSDPPVIENGKHQLHSEMNSLPILGSTAIYSCNVGYELVVNDMNLETEMFFNLTCDLEKENKTVYWSGNMAKCKKKVTCDDPGVSADGQREGNCCSPDDVLHFSCNESFQLVGENETQCLPNGSWSFRRPLCRPLDVSCDLPPSIMHGIVTGYESRDYYLPWEEVEVLCEPGYSYSGPSKFILCDEEGQWEDEFSNCTEFFCDLPEPLANGTIIELESTNMTKLPYKFELTYVCDKGYRIVQGDNSRFCDSYGWSGKAPYCSVILCPDPGVPEYGFRENYSNEVGAKVRFKCAAGYNLVGSFERYCMPNGQWTGELARCDSYVNYCTNPGIPINGFKDSSNYDMNEIVGFGCRQGYIQVGSESRQCLPNRSWSGTETACVGPYDFDSSAHASYRLKVIINEKIAKQKYETEKYIENIETHTNRMIPCYHFDRFIFYFVFDVSPSIGRNKFQTSINFAKAIVNRIGISRYGALVGALTFGSGSQIKFLPFTYYTTEEVIDALDKIIYTDEGSFSSSALALLREECIPLTKANRYCYERQKSIVFVLSDGTSNMGGDPQSEADILKKAGVEIYCIGITGNVQRDSLYRIASDSTEEPHIFILESYSTLTWLTQELTNGTLDYSQCGLGLERVGNRLLDGTEPWPWMAYIYFPYGSVDRARAKLTCGGSIINEFFILTAAHCMYNSDLVIRDVQEVIVKLDLTNVRNKTFVQEPEVKSFFIHPKYKPGNYDYDIALLQLNKPIQYNNNVRPICLPPTELPEESNLYKPSEYVLVPGYASTWWRREIFVHESRDIYLPIQSREACNESLVKNGFDANRCTDRMFCAGEEKGDTVICGDYSGEPLIQSQLNDEGYIYWTQVGIASWGFRCDLERPYIIYSHVSNLRLWIDQQIKDSLAATL